MFELPKSAFPGRKTGSSASASQGEPPIKKGKSKHKMNLEEVAELAQATAELALETKVDTRMHEGLLTKTVLANESHSAVKAALEEGQKINKERQEKKGAAVGSPHVRQCLRFVQAIAQSEEVSKLKEGHKFKEVIATWWQMIQGMESDEMLPEILIFQATKPRISSVVEGMEAYAKIRIALGPKSLEFQEELVEFMKEIGWKVKHGPPPASTKERVVRNLAKGR